MIIRNRSRSVGKLTNRTFSDYRTRDHLRIGMITIEESMSIIEGIRAGRVGGSGFRAFVFGIFC